MDEVLKGESSSALTREHSADVRWKADYAARHGLWFGPQGSDRKPDITQGRRSTRRRANALLLSPARMGAHRSTHGLGDQSVQGCASGVFWLQKPVTGTWSKQTLGSSRSASCSNGEWVEVSVIRCLMPPQRKLRCMTNAAARAVVAGERVIIGGRRPGPGEAVPFDEAMVGAGSGGQQVGQPQGWLTEGAATLGVRGYVAGSVDDRERLHREISREGVTIGAPPGSRGILFS